MPLAPVGQTHAIRHLQRTIGNRGVQELLQRRAREVPVGLAAKLSVSEPGDTFEQEADRVADQVMRMSDTRVQGACSCHGCSTCQAGQSDHAQLLQRDVDDSDRVAAEDSSPINDVLGSAGKPLESDVRAFFEPRFERDFSQVRVHTDERAADSARSVNAVAYTVGRDVVFGAGEYDPQSAQGKRLLAHELTHVVQQQAAPTNNVATASEGPPGRESPQTAGGASTTTPAIQRQAPPPAPAGPAGYKLSTSGCGTAPYVLATVEAAALAAFNVVKTTNCIKSKQLKDAILDEFDGLNLDCHNNTGPCGMASRYFSQTVNLYTNALNASCGPLESTILHEVIHLTERGLFGHGDLAGACEKACFGFGSGDAAKCTFEQGFVPVFGGTLGTAFSSQGERTWQARLYLGIEKRGPVLGVFHPSLGFGLGLIGDTTTGQPGAAPTGTSALFSVLGGLRIDPGHPGGGYVSLFGGPALAVRDGKRAIGAEAGFGLGYRWRWIDVSVEAGYDYDPTRAAGIDKYFTLGGSIKFGPGVQR